MNEILCKECGHGIDEHHRRARGTGCGHAPCKCVLLASDIAAAALAEARRGAVEICKEVRDACQDALDSSGVDAAECCINALYDLMATEPDTLTESVAVAYGQADLSSVNKVIVSKEFAKRWTTNPQHYRDYYGADEVEIQP